MYNCMCLQAWTAAEELLEPVHMTRTDVTARSHCLIRADVIEKNLCHLIYCLRLHHNVPLIHTCETSNNFNDACHWCIFNACNTKKIRKIQVKTSLV